MGKQYAVYHSQKGRGSGAGLGNHIDREKGKEHSYRNADPSRLKNNVNFGILEKDEFGNTVDVSKLSLEKAISYRIKSGYKKDVAIRKDAVKYISHILTGSHEQMMKIGGNKEQFKKWVLKNQKFVVDEFGRNNLVRFTLHLDETTPHIHCVTVPITPEGGLSAKRVFGNKKAMQERQDRYAEAMKEFGLHRGQRNFKVKHQDVTRFYGNLQETKTKLEAVKDDLPPFLPRHRINPKSYLEAIKTTLNDKFDNFINERQFKNTVNMQS